MSVKLIEAGKNASVIGSLNDAQIKQMYDEIFKQTGGGLGYKEGKVRPKAGGLPNFNKNIADFQDSGVFYFDSAKERQTKSGENKGRKWFSAEAIDGGHPGGFDIDECVHVQLKYKDKVVLVGGTPGKDDEGEYILNPYLILGSKLRGQKVSGELDLVTA